MIKKEIILPLNQDETMRFLGEKDSHLRLWEKIYSCELALRNNHLWYSCENKQDAQKIEEAIYYFCSLIQKGKELEMRDILQYSASEKTAWQQELISYTASGKPLFAKNQHQHDLLQAIQKNTLTFAIGAAGTGKTFLAVLMAVKFLKAGEIDKIILSRPAVEAGESLGFLPGDLREKVDPYLMPLYDSLDLLLGHEQVEKYLERGTIEIIPLAYMRGRTLQNAFVLLDEAQNTSGKQMLMFLSRLGQKAKMVVTGDITQIDLSMKKANTGLVLAKEKLQGIEDIAIVEFTREDVVRHPLVEKILAHFQIAESENI